MTRPSAQQIIDHLGLAPNQTCGYVGFSYTSTAVAAQGALAAPFDDGRPLGTALYFLVTPDAPVRLHRIRNDQLYHYYAGDPLELLLLTPNGRGELHVVGPDLLAGHHVQLLIPGGTFHLARVAGERQWFLGGSTEWPGVIAADVELGDLEQLAAEHPGAADALRQFAANP